jgi:hypothetical protein
MSPIVTCAYCGRKNRVPDRREERDYRCAACKQPFKFKTTDAVNESNSKGGAVPVSPPQKEQSPGQKEMIAEFVRALDEEIKAIKDGKGGSQARVFDGRFVRQMSNLYVYSFVLENFLATVDDAPVEVQVGSTRVSGQIIQTQGLEVIVAVEQDLGPSVPEARLITSLYFLHELLKKKYQAGPILNCDLANRVFNGTAGGAVDAVVLPYLEVHAQKHPNDSQLKAITLSQSVELTIVWGPPGTGKTETLARVVECFVKRGKRVLVVAHSNAAVDEATEDIAEILKTTDFYHRGKIIRLGICHKKSIEANYEMVLLDKAADRLGVSLRQEKENLELQKSRIDERLNQISAAVNAVRAAQELSQEAKRLSNDLDSIRLKRAGVRDGVVQQSRTLDDLRRSLAEAKSASTIVRLFRGLDPMKIQHRIDQGGVQLDALGRQLSELDSRGTEIEQRQAAVEARLRDSEREAESYLSKLRVSPTQLKALGDQLSADRSKILSRINEIQKELDEIKKRVLSEAIVVSTTLTKTFSAKEFPDALFDVLVVDEASMAPMPHLYWALTRCQKAAVIVGDFLQLPPICVSQEAAAREWLGRSIYDQLRVATVTKAKADQRVRLLDRQYRMNPAISAIPNHLFYEGLLSDDISTKNRVLATSLSKQPLTLVDTTLASPWCSRLSTGSRFNVYTALLAATIAQRLVQEDATIQVGLIAPYNAQVRLLGKILKDMGLERVVRAATVHRFQGGESDAIIFDTVEGPGVSVSPMLDDSKEHSDARLLLNVALTRAKSKVFLIANSSYLRDQLPRGASLYSILDEFEQQGDRLSSDALVDSYFMRDFDRIVKLFVDSASRGLAKPPDNSLFDENNFYPFFFSDLQNAKQEVIIMCPFLSVRRAGQFVELFRILVTRGVKVRVITRPPTDQSGSLCLDAGQVIQQLKAIGVEVQERRRMHQKVAIIDRSVAWEGSLNILSHRDTDEQMRRLPFATAVAELVRLYELDDSSGGGARRVSEVPTLEVCKACGKEMVVRRGRYGPFLSCSGHPQCGATRNIRRWDKIITRVTCPSCAEAMVVRQSARGPFLGCSAYPKCKKTLPI